MLDRISFTLRPRKLLSKFLLANLSTASFALSPTWFKTALEMALLYNDSSEVFNVAIVPVVVEFCSPLKLKFV